MITRVIKQNYWVLSSDHWINWKLKVNCQKEISIPSNNLPLHSKLKPLLLEQPLKFHNLHPFLPTLYYWIFKFSPPCVLCLSHRSFFAVPEKHQAQCCSWFTHLLYLQGNVLLPNLCGSGPHLLGPSTFSVRSFWTIWLQVILSGWAQCNIQIM